MRRGLISRNARANKFLQKYMRPPVRVVHLRLVRKNHRSFATRHEEMYSVKHRTWIIDELSNSFTDQ